MLTPDFLMHLIQDFPLNTPPVSLQGNLNLDDILGHTLNVWPDIKQALGLIQ